MQNNFMTFSEMSYVFQKKNGLGMMTWSLENKCLQEHILSESSAWWYFIHSWFMNYALEIFCYRV